MELLNELLYTDQVRFSIVSKITEGNLYLTQMKNEDLGTFFALANSERESREKCAIQVLENLRKINDIIDGFRLCKIY